MPDLTVIHATPRFVVIDKPAWLLSVPGIGPDKQDCVASRVRAMFPASRGPLIAHRLDMETSGLLVLGLDEDAQRNLSAQFENRAVAKRYVALLEGTPDAAEGTIELPLRLDVDNRPYQIVDFEQGRTSLTRFRVLASEPGRTRVEFEPLTGRTHQLRVHAAFSGDAFWPAREGKPPARSMAQPPPAPRVGLGRPIIGDVLYGRVRAERLMLHASELDFNDPGTGARVRLESGAPF
ncbi:Dual-specificity RNA pseudouridine synthase RluA [Phycisphaerales bacterium]|nr:Dual-specificity RNA pseudouridine synthase RluA [Phycisphaerales bacterium]